MIIRFRTYNTNYEIDSDLRAIRSLNAPMVITSDANRVVADARTWLPLVAHGSIAAGLPLCFTAGTRGDLNPFRTSPVTEISLVEPMVASPATAQAVPAAA